MICVNYCRQVHTIFDHRRKACSALKIAILQYNTIFVYYLTLSECRACTRDKNYTIKMV